jgi:tetratricopeptide (TPR) repeat protein
MNIKHILGTGLLIYANFSAAWVLDETVSIPQADLFESPEKNILEGPVLPGLYSTEILTEIDKKPIEILPESLPKVPVLEKKVSSLTPQDIANKKYNAAIEKIGMGLSGDAEKIFLEILKDYPPHILSRVQLSKLSILGNDYEKAERILTENPDYVSNHPAYLQTLALIYERTGKKKEALKILEQVPKEYRKNVEFYSLLASLYQQTGNHVLAQQYYHGLLSKEPNNMTWLLGLSISLDSGGEKKMALTYYKRILEHGNLDPNILAFVKNRFNKLSKNKK